jgi:YidC/Oxa1 family membrane protein insertase
MVAIFHILVYQPVYNASILLYAIIPWADFGLAIIATTVILKLILYPLSQKQIETQREMQVIQPKIKALQKKHKNDKEALAKETMALYKEHHINPAAGCLPLILQIVFLLAIYQVILNISQSQFQVVASDLYSFVPQPENIQHFFLHLINLAQPNIVLAALAAGALFYQTKMMMPAVELKEQTSATEPDFNSIMMKQMLYIGPGLTLIFGATLPSGLALYWLTATLITIYQQKQKIKHTPAPSATN